MGRPRGHAPSGTPDPGGDRCASTGNVPAPTCRCGRTSEDGGSHDRRARSLGHEGDAAHGLGRGELNPLRITPHRAWRRARAVLHPAGCMLAGCSLSSSVGCCSRAMMTSTPTGLPTALMASFVPKAHAAWVGRCASPPVTLRIGEIRPDSTGSALRRRLPSCRPEQSAIPASRASTQDWTTVGRPTLASFRRAMVALPIDASPVKRPARGDARTSVPIRTTAAPAASSVRRGSVAPAGSVVMRRGSSAEMSASTSSAIAITAASVVLPARSARAAWPVSALPTISRRALAALLLAFERAAGAKRERAAWLSCHTALDSIIRRRGTSSSHPPAKTERCKCCAYCCCRSRVSSLLRRSAGTPGHLAVRVRARLSRGFHGGGSEELRSRRSRIP